VAPARAALVERTRAAPVERASGNLWYSLVMKHGRFVVPWLALAALGAGCKREDAPPAAGSSGSSAAAGASGPTAAAEPAPESVARGKQAIGAMKKQLVAALTEALKGGAPSAIAVCSGVAPGIAQSLGSGGVTVGRATRKPRNPANVATGWRADALAKLEAMVAAGQPLEGAAWSARLPDGKTAYAEPLVIQPLCVTCHGKELAPDVREALAARYPADQATGYAVGDLRGVAWAEIAAAPPPPR
jgi:hypothetical protein